MTEVLAMLPAATVDAMLHPLTGIAARCKFLPTAADLMGFVESSKPKFNVTDGDSGYKRFKPGEGDPENMAPLEKRKAAVIEALGYDPAKVRAPERKPLDPGIRDAIENGSWSISMLKSPPKPPSRELIELLTEQGYFDSGDAA